MDSALKTTSVYAKTPYVPIYLACLKSECFAPCDLFIKTGDNQHTLFAQKGYPFDLTNRKNLVDLGLNQLYISDEDTPLYFEYLRQKVLAVIENPKITDKVKAEVVHASCKDILSRVFHEPRASFIEQAHGLLVPTIDLIISNDNATRHLVQLTEHDHGTYIHSTNVGIFCVALSKTLLGSKNDCDMRNLGVGFFLHDLGKCKIPLQILNKPGPLNQEEWEVIKKHPSYGYEMLLEADRMTEEAKIIILQHHEKDDGNGYPNNLTSKEIHPYARICRLADVYEALTAIRPYRAPCTTFKALKEMKNQMLADMDTTLFGNFIKLFET